MELDLLWLILAAIVGTLCVVSFGFLGRLGKKKQHNSLPPGDMGWPLIGNMWSFVRAYKSQNPESFINNLKKRYGKSGIYKTKLFWNPSIIVCSPELCRKVFIDYDQFHLGYPISNLMLNGIPIDVISSSGHRRLRKLTTAGLIRYEWFTSYIDSIEQIVIDTFEKWSKTNEPILFFPETNRIAFKVIMAIFLGSTPDDTLVTSMEKDYTDLFNGLFCSPIYIPGFAYHKAHKARKRLVNYIRGELGERKERKPNDPNSKRGLIDLIREAEDEKGEKLDDEVIVVVLVMFMAAGRESTGRAASWATVHLHEHPQMLKKAKEEQEEIIKLRPSSQKGLSISEIKQMKYLSKVIDETLRRRTNSFALFRQAKNDTYLNEHFIPKGWKVLVWQSAIHMDPEIYPNPKQFDPSRWDDFVPRPGEFLPFGAGSATCPAGDLARIEISIFLHYFLLDYKLEQLNPEAPVNYLPSQDPVDNCPAKIIKIQ